MGGGARGDKPCGGLKSKMLRGVAENGVGDVVVLWGGRGLVEYRTVHV